MIITRTDCLFFCLVGYSYYDCPFLFTSCLLQKNNYFQANYEFLGIWVITVFGSLSVRVNLPSSHSFRPKDPDLPSGVWIVNTKALKMLLCSDTKIHTMKNSLCYHSNLTPGCRKWKWETGTQNLSRGDLSRWFVLSKMDRLGLTKSNSTWAELDSFTIVSLGANIPQIEAWSVFANISIMKPWERGASSICWINYSGPRIIRNQQSQRG